MTPRLSRVIEEWLIVIKFFGITKSTYRFFVRLVGKIIPYKVHVCLHLPLSDLKPETQPATWQYERGPARTDDYHQLANDEEFGTTIRFIEDALEKGDRCSVVRDSGKIVAYSWSSVAHTEFMPDLTLVYSKSLMYQYKAFTHRDYRGQRLIQSAVTRDLEKYSQGGYRGAFTVIESDNFSSLKAFRRLGFEPIGKITILRLLGRYLLGTNGSLHCYGIKLLPTQDLP